MKRTVLVLIIAVATLTLWANGNQEVPVGTVNFSTSELAYAPIGQVKVEPSKEILAAFESLGIDSYYLIEQTYTEDDSDGNIQDYTIPAPVTKEVSEKMTTIISENKNNIVNLIESELTAHLKRGRAEETFMTIGSYEFTASLDYPEI
jgi:hypothetical protein